MFETKTVGPCYVWKLKWREGNMTPWLPQWLRPCIHYCCLLLKLSKVFSVSLRIFFQHHEFKFCVLLKMNVFKHFIIFRLHNVCSQENFKKNILRSLILGKFFILVIFACQLKRKFAV